MPYYEKTLGIGKRVDELKKMHDVTNRELSKVIDVSDSYVHRLLADQAQWGSEWIEAVAEYFGVSAVYLITGDSVIHDKETGDEQYLEALGEVIVKLKDTSEKERNRAFTKAIFKMLKIMIGQEE